MAEALLAAAGSLLLYLAIGWRMAVRNMARAWESAQRAWTTEDSIRGSVKAQAVCMILFWPVYLPGLAVNRLLGRAIDAGNPEVLRAKIAERDRHIAQLERELGMHP